MDLERLIFVQRRREDKQCQSFAMRKERTGRVRPFEMEVPRPNLERPDGTAAIEPHGIILYVFCSFTRLKEESRIRASLIKITFA